jgi:histidinol phosphatase-like enzyme
LDRIEVCPHEEGTCRCRKPEIGAFVRVLEDWPDVSATASAVVGDSAEDVVAGHRVGARTFLVGATSRRMIQAEVARRLGAAPDEEAQSLPALVADGRLVDWLRSGWAG